MLRACSLVMGWVVVGGALSLSVGSSFEFACFGGRFTVAV